MGLPGDGRRPAYRPILLLEFLACHTCLLMDLLTASFAAHFGLLDPFLTLGLIVALGYWRLTLPRVPLSINRRSECFLWRATFFMTKKPHCTWCNSRTKLSWEAHKPPLHGTSEPLYCSPSGCLFFFWHDFVLCRVLQHSFPLGARLNASELV